MTPILLLGLKASVMALILAIGLGATVADLTYLWRRPAQLLRALLAMYVIVPVAGFLLVRTLDLPQPVEIALLILAVSAGAPLLPRKLMKFGHGAYMLSLVATSSIAAVAATPLWLEILKPIYGLEIDLTAFDVAAAIAKAFVLPLAIGMLVRWRFPETGRMLSERILIVAGAALAVCALLLLGLHAELLLDTSLSAWLALAVMTAVALAIGHLLGGPRPNDRTALAIACATRHVGIAILVASSLPGARAAVMVAAYLLVTILVSLPYLRMRRSGAAVEKV